MCAQEERRNEEKKKKRPTTMSKSFILLFVVFVYFLYICLASDRFRVRARALPMSVCFIYLLICMKIRQLSPTYN